MIGVFFVFAVILTLIIYTVRNSFKQDSEVKSVSVETPVAVMAEDIEETPVVSGDVYNIYTENYNFQRAMELLGENEEEEAFKYLKKAIDDDENNGYAHAWIARIFLRHESYGTALKAVNNAISCLPEVNQAWLYLIRARVYRGLQDNDLWKKDVETALSLDPKDTQALEEMSDYFYFQEEYAESDSVIDKFIELEPHNPYGYMVKGRNGMMREHYEEALNLFDYAERLDANYCPAPAFKAEMLIKLNRLSEAVNCEIVALQLMFTQKEENQKAIYVRNLLAQKACEMFVLKLKAKVASGDHKSEWLGMLGVVYSASGQYVEASKCYRELYLHDHNSADLSFESYCWRKAGNFHKASLLLENALKDDEENYTYMENLMLLKGEEGLFEEAISLGDKMISLQPDNAMAYYNRGRMKQMTGNHSGAIKDFDTVLTLTENNIAFAYFYRGLSRFLMQNIEEANKDFSAIIDKSELVGRDQFLAMAVLLKDGPVALHDTDNTLEPEFKSVLEKLDDYVSHNYEEVKDDPSQYSDAIEAYMMRAAVECHAGETAMSLADVERALKLGANRFHYYRHTYLLQPLHNNPDFITLMDSFEKRVISSWEDICLEEEANTNIDTGGNAFIPFVKEGAMCKVPCKINNLPLHFIFDTGASDVTMSTVEATFMLKNGYLRQQDLSGKEYYMTASGEIAEGTKVKLREVDFGGFKLNNVKASIVKSQNAPLLLGQSVLQQLGRIQIDNENSTIQVIR